MSAASAVDLLVPHFAYTPGSSPSKKKCTERFRRTIKQLEIDGCQLPMEGLLVDRSFEVMSKVSINPFVPLNS
jgi:hypothetical protein